MAASQLLVERFEAFFMLALQKCPCLFCVIKSMYTCTFFSATSRPVFPGASLSSTRRAAADIPCLGAVGKSLRDIVDHKQGPLQPCANRKGQLQNAPFLWDSVRCHTFASRL